MTLDSGTGSIAGTPVVLGAYDFIVRVTDGEGVTIEKGFTIDIEKIAEEVGGRFALFGNLDAVGVLQDGSDDELRTEIARQLAAGRRNGSRFVMCLGSPVTPATGIDRVGLYCELVHELN